MSEIGIGVGGKGCGLRVEARRRQEVGSVGGTDGAQPLLRSAVCVYAHTHVQLHARSPAHPPCLTLSYRCPRLT